MQQFPLIEITGPPYRRGVQFGRACGDLIRRYPDVLRRVVADETRLRAADVHAAELDDEELMRRALSFLPWFEAFAPEQVEEIRGVAVGAEVPFGLALLTNVRAEVAGLDHDAAGCTAVALGRGATANGSVFIGQNQDQHPAMQELVVILRVIPDNGPRILMVTFGGLLGYGGINSEGIGYVMNALANSTWRRGLPHYPVKRALLQQRDLSGCLGVFNRAPVGSCANSLLVDRRGLVDVEVTPDGYAVIRPGEHRGDYLVHTNHFQCASLAIDEQLLARLPDSTARCRRMEELVRERVGGLTLADLKGFFADHDGYPQGICRHAAYASQGSMRSIYSVIGEPDRGRLHVSAGNPCENTFLTYEL